MFQKWKRRLSMFVALCMMIAMLPNTVFEAQAAAGNYELYAEYDYNSNSMLPGSQMTVKTRLMQDMGDHWEDVSGYTISATTSTNQYLTVAVNGQNLDVTSNTASGSSWVSTDIELKAYINGTECAQLKTNINVHPEIYVIPEELKDPGNNNNAVEPDVGEILNLSSLFSMQKKTYDPQTGNVTTVTEDISANQSKYWIEMEYRADCWEVVDTNGNPVSGNVVLSNGNSQITGLYNLKRISESGTFIIVRVCANDASGKIWYPASNSYEFDRLNYSASWDWDYNNNGPAVFWSDQMQASLALSTTRSCDVEFVIGNGPSQNFTPFSVQTGLFDKTTDASGQVNGITLYPAAMAAAGVSQNFEVLTRLVKNGYVLWEMCMSMELRPVREEYHFRQSDREVLLGDSFRVDKTVEYYVQNAQYPDGFNTSVAVTGVTVTDISGSNILTVQDNGSCWDLRANNPGQAKVTMTYTTMAGTNAVYDFMVNTTDSLWECQVEMADHVNMILPGDSKEITALVSHWRYDAQQGKYDADTPCEVEWNIRDVSNVPYLTLTPNASDSSRVMLTASADIIADNAYRNMMITCKVFELAADGSRVGTSPVTTLDFMISPTDKYRTIQVSGFDPDLGIGQSMNLTPVRKEIYLDANNQHAESIVNDASFFWNYDPQTLSIVDNQDGSYTFTRNVSQKVDFALAANTNDGMHWEWSYSLNALDYSDYFVCWNWNFPAYGGLQVFGDNTAAEFILNTDSLAQKSGYTVKITLGHGNGNRFQELSGYQNFVTTLTDSNGNVTGMRIDGTKFMDSNPAGTYSVKTAVSVNGYEVYADYSDLLLKSSTYQYPYEDMTLLPDGMTFIDNYVDCHYPGVEQVEITDVTVGSDVARIEVYSHGWSVFANKMGDTDVTITHKTVDGGQTTTSFKLYVTDQVWYGNVELTDRTDAVLPGQEVNLYAKISRKYYDVQTQESYFDENAAFEVEWGLCDPAAWSSYVTVTPDPSDDQKVNLQVAANVPASANGFAVYYAVYALDENGNRIQDANGEDIQVVNGTQMIWVSTSYYVVEVDAFEKNADLWEVGETITVTPKIKRHYLDSSNTVQREDCTGYAETYFNWSYDPEEIEVVADSNGTTFTMKRLVKDSIEIGLECGGPTHHGSPLHCTRDYEIGELDYGISYKGLQGAETVTVNDTETAYVLEVDTVNLSDKPLARIGWKVIYLDEQGNEKEASEGFAVNGTSITLDASKLMEYRNITEGSVDIGVCAYVMSNGIDAEEEAGICVTVQPTEATVMVDEDAVNTVSNRLEEVVNTITDGGAGFSGAIMSGNEVVISAETVNKIQNAIAGGKQIITEINVITQNKEAAMAEAAEDVAKIENALKEQESLSIFLDLKIMVLAKDPGTGETESLGTMNILDEEMEFSILLPEGEIKENRSFYVLRVHEGILDRLTANKVSDRILSFKTDRFSTYALTYEDDTSGNTGEGMPGIPAPEGNTGSAGNGESTDSNSGNTENTASAGNQSTSNIAADSNSTAVQTGTDQSVHTDETVPATGDSFRIGLWGFLMLLGVLGICTAEGYRRKKFR